ncbi:PLP-dependent aminotransferase family protein [Streptomyces sp. YC504]|uniref:PLP-dependent aminotransferase family protein n=1 Tax=Streptomyces mesophilus TaxID=1775132 RepID=A0A6G4XIN6_9ACTN|nr:PLP-dependent aminotransferase family protein [Streptomyces mesophilus]
MDRAHARTWTPVDLTEILGGWATATGPLYRRLAAALRAAVASGDLAAGDRLPAERALAAALQVSRATVVAALDELRAAGLVDSRRGSGTHVAGRGAGPALGGDRRVPGGHDPVPGGDGRVPGGGATSLVQRLVDGPGDTISLAVASAEPATAEIRRVLRELLDPEESGDDPLAALLSGPAYHPGGLPALRDAVARHFTGQGLPTTPDQVLITTGATQALALTAQLFVRRRTPVVAEAPSWPGCLDAYVAAGALLRRIPLDEDGPRVDAAAAALPGAALLHLTPTYHNPTGILMSAARRRRIAELCAAEGVLTVEDIAYDTRIGRADEPPPVAAFAPADAPVLTIGSLAKAVWGGLRIGWVRGPAEILARLARAKAVHDLGSPLLDQALAARLLPRLEELKDARAAVLRARLDRLEDLMAGQLPGWTWCRPAGGAALWTRLPGGVDARVFAQVTLRHGVEVVPGAATDPSGAHDDHIRIPFTLPADRLDELVRRLAAAWSDLGNDRSAPRATT